MARSQKFNTDTDIIAKFDTDVCTKWSMYNNAISSLFLIVFCEHIHLGPKQSLRSLFYVLISDIYLVPEMALKWNLWAILSTVINESFDINIIIPALTELANNDGNNKDKDNRSVLDYFYCFVSVCMINLWK